MSSNGTEFGVEGGVYDSSAGPAATADGGTSSEDASGAGNGAASNTAGTDGSSGSGPKPGAPDAGGSTSTSSHDAGTGASGHDAGTGGSTNDAGTSASTTGGDGGPCTVNLSCVLPAPASTGDIRQDCVNRINQFRTTCACVKPLARWTAGEACADMDAQYDGMMMVGHAGAMANICNWGSGQDECPGYPSDTSIIGTCLQSMWSEGPPPAGTTIAECESPQMIASCFEAHGHFINMSNPDFTQVACGFATDSSGTIWAAQNFSP